MSATRPCACLALTRRAEAYFHQSACMMHAAQGNSSISINHPGARVHLIRVAVTRRLSQCMKCTPKGTGNIAIIQALALVRSGKRGQSPNSRCIEPIVGVERSHKVRGGLAQVVVMGL